MRIKNKEKIRRGIIVGGMSGLIFSFILIYSSFFFPVINYLNPAVLICGKCGNEFESVVYIFTTIPFYITFGALIGIIIKIIKK